jgi:hypothetical protein
MDEEKVNKIHVLIAEKSTYINIPEIGQSASQGFNQGSLVDNYNAGVNSASSYIPSSLSIFATFSTSDS